MIELRVAARDADEPKIEGETVVVKLWTKRKLRGEGYAPALGAIVDPKGPGGFACQLLDDVHPHAVHDRRAAEHGLGQVGDERLVGREGHVVGGGKLWKRGGNGQLGIVALSKRH